MGARLINFSDKGGIMRFDRFFKICVLIMAAAFIFIYYDNSQTNRFQLVHHEGAGFRLFDSKTGTICFYASDVGKWVKRTAWSDAIDMETYQKTRPAPPPSAPAPAPEKAPERR
jgi:hypothetical protein